MHYINLHFTYLLTYFVDDGLRRFIIVITGSAVAAASDIHRQMPTHMADIRRDWLTNQNTD